MSLNFPNSPTEGDTWFDEGNLWTYTDGAWVIGSLESATTKIIDAIPDVTTESGWQLWGDTLIQWGTGVSGAGAGGAVQVFPIPFKVGTVPAVSCQSRDISTANGPRAAQLVSGSTTEAQFAARGVGSSGGTYSLLYTWIAVGEAPDADKLPKEVATSLGNYEVFVDPTGVSSYRIIGDMLECWGTTAAAGTQQVVSFGKTFNTNPTFTATPDVNRRMTNTAVLSTTGATVNIYDDAGAAASSDIGWYAIGQWDGVS